MKTLTNYSFAYRIGANNNILEKVYDCGKVEKLEDNIELSYHNGCDICAKAKPSFHDGCCEDCCNQYPGLLETCACGSTNQVAGGLCAECAVKEGWTINL